MAVYHHPARPGDAVLEPGPDWWSIGFRLAAGAVLAGMGLFAIALFLAS